MSAQKQYSIPIAAENSVSLFCLFQYFDFFHTFGWEQFGYFVFFLYLEFFGWEQLKKSTLYCTCGQD